MDLSKQQQCIVCGGNVLELFPTEIWFGLGSPASGLRSSQLPVPLLDFHSFTSSFSATGFAFPQSDLLSSSLAVFPRDVPKNASAGGWDSSTGGHHGTPHQDTQGWSLLGLCSYHPPHPCAGASGMSQGLCLGFCWPQLGEMQLM